MGCSEPDPEFRRRRIIIKNKTPEEIQKYMEEHQNNVDKLEKQKDDLQKEKENIKNRIEYLKNRLNPNNIEFKFKLLNERIYSIFIDKNENLNTALTQFSTKVEEESYADINKIKIMYGADDKTELFRQGKPISSLNFNSNFPFVVLPLNNKS